MKRIIITAALLAASITSAQAQCRDQFECLGERVNGANNRAADARENARRAAAETAERERQMQAQAKIDAERRRRQEEAARAQAVIDAKPINQVYRGYQHYAHIKFCNDVRQGYVFQYVNDIELERADKVIKAIVAQTTAEDASIDTDDIWKRALRAVVGRYAEEAWCRHSLVALFEMAPEPVYTIAKPQ